MDPSADQRRISNIQALRGIAAFMVASMHLIGLAARGGHPLFVSAHSFALCTGPIGVDIFFVISGFIISVILTRKPTAASFAAKRMARIYPMFWLTLVLLLVMEQAGGLKTGLADVFAHPASVLLIKPAAAQPVSWTLVFEIHFYLVAAVALLAGAHAVTVMIFWSMAQIAIVVLTAMKLLPPYIFFHPVSLEFIFGLAAGLVAPRLRLPAPLSLATAALSFAAVMGFYFGLEAFGQNKFLRVLAWGLPAAVIVLAALQLEAQQRIAPRWLQWLGDVSYSIYLLHWPIGVATGVLFRGLTGSVAGALACLLISAAATLAASAFTFRLIETPLNTAAARWRTKDIPRVLASSKD